jgi:hypothetical protein
LEMGVSWTICPGWLQNHHLPDLSLPISYYYRREPSVPGFS